MIARQGTLERISRPSVPCGPLPGCTDADWHVVNELGFAGIESVLTGRRVELPNANRTRMIHANG